MARETPATRALAGAVIAFTIHEYDYDPAAERIGLHAAEALGEDPARVLKTLMTKVDGRPVCVILPSDREVAMKALAVAAGGKSVTMMVPADAERMTGYKVGGISPLGQRRRVPTIMDAAALDQPHIYVNGGRRGLQIRLSPADLMQATGALAAPISS